MQIDKEDRIGRGLCDFDGRLQAESGRSAQPQQAGTLRVQSVVTVYPEALDGRLNE